jgi:hypothetical protein
MSDEVCFTVIDARTLTVIAGASSVRWEEQSPEGCEAVCGEMIAAKQA